MPTGTSDHLFYLIKSLSGSEWSTYKRLNDTNIYNPNRSHDKGDMAHKVVATLAEMDTFDLEALRSKFILNGTKAEVQRYKDAKRLAEVWILDAIEQAPENQTEKFTLEKLPNLLQHLENRRIEFRIKAFLQKYLPITENNEYFEVHKNLLRFQINQIQRTKPYPERENLIKQLHERIATTSEKQSNLILLQHKRDTLISALNSLADKNEITTHNIYAELLAQTFETKSVKAQILLLDLKWRVALARRKFLDFLQVLDEITILNRENSFLADVEEYFSVILTAFNLRIFHFIREGNLQKGASMITELENWTRGKRSHLQKMAERTQLTNKLMLARKQLSEQKIVEICESATQTFQDLAYPLHDKDYLNFTLLASEANICIQNTPQALKWLGKLTATKPNPIKPRFTLVANLWMVLARIDQDDTELLESELRRVKRYAKKWAPDSKFASWILNIGKQAMDRKAVNFQDFLKEIETIPSKEQNYLTILPFSEWLESKHLGNSLIEVLKSK